MGSFVGSAHRHGRKVKVMRSGRHVTPSQVEKVAEKAGKAAPAMAVTAGALMAVPHGHAAAPARHAAVAEAVVTAKTGHSAAAGSYSAAETVLATKAALVRSARPDAASQAAAVSHTYTVRSGDTLSTISSQFYGTSGEWQWLYHVNQPAVSDPNRIYPGQELNVPADPPASYTLPASEAPATTSSVASAPSGRYQAKHAAPGDDAGTDSGGSPASASAPAPTTASNLSGGPATTSAGTYSCGGLESLWEQAGGSGGEAVMAASIAMAESGGDPDAISPTNDYGLWQINGSHGAQATLSPLGNAEAAVSISGNGSNWDPWTTFTSGAYSGRC
jgi:LysM repeat protein